MGVDGCTVVLWEDARRGARWGIGGWDRFEAGLDIVLVEAIRS